MTEVPHHPFRDAQIHVYKRLDVEDEYLARFYPYNTYPVVWKGTTPEEATQRAEAFRVETLEKHEANYLQKLKNLERANKSKEKAADQKAGDS